MDGAEVDPCFQQMGGEAVAQQVNATGLADSGPSFGLLEDLFGGPGADGLARFLPRKEPPGETTDFPADA